MATPIRFRLLGGRRQIDLQRPWKQPADAGREPLPARATRSVRRLHCRTREDALPARWYSPKERRTCCQGCLRYRGRSADLSHRPSKKSPPIGNLLRRRPKLVQQRVRSPQHGMPQELNRYRQFQDQRRGHRPRCSFRGLLGSRLPRSHEYSPQKNYQTVV